MKNFLQHQKPQMRLALLFGIYFLAQILFR